MYNRLNLRGDIYFYPLGHEICFDEVITAVSTKRNVFPCVRKFRHKLLPPFSLFLPWIWWRQVCAEC